MEDFRFACTARVPGREERLPVELFPWPNRRQSFVLFCCSVQVDINRWEFWSVVLVEKRII